MEWLYIIGLIGYYLYRAYNKGIKNATENGKNEPIKPINKRKPEKTLDEILKELVDNAQTTQTKKAEANKLPDVKVLDEKTKVVKEVQKPKQVERQSTVAQNHNKKQANVLHKTKDYQSSIEYDEKIENILSGKVESIETADIYNSSKINNEIGSHLEGNSNANRQIKIKDSVLNTKDLVLAQIILERKYA
jgi:hypothetical protein